MVSPRDLAIVPILPGTIATGSRSDTMPRRFLDSVCPVFVTRSGENVRSARATPRRACESHSLIAGRMFEAIRPQRSRAWRALGHRSVREATSGALSD
jgi:hypothetical protein